MTSAREKTEQAMDQAPSASGECEQVSRRSLLLSMLAFSLLPASAPLLCIKSQQGSVVVRNGWVLRADDLDRLAIA